MEQSTKKIIIALDGFSSCGKSTFAKSIAQRLGYIFIDTGAMYRSVAVWAIENGIDTATDKETLISSLDKIKIDIKYIDDVPNGVAVNEAVELAKKYGTNEDASFINGILGTIAKA